MILNHKVLFSWMADELSGFAPIAECWNSEIKGRDPNAIVLMNCRTGYSIFLEFFVKRTAADPQSCGGHGLVPVTFIEDFLE